jgi:gliding motility-associated lipoprotein GldH
VFPLLSRRLLLWSVLFSVIFSGCVPAPYYQRSETVPGAAWEYGFRPRFAIEILDTTAQYKTYFLIRHTQGYPYNNIWLLISTKGPGDKQARKERVNVVLAEPSGKWMGRGMGEVWEQRMVMQLQDSTLFRRRGTWEISVEQNMRVNPLPEIIDAGIRIERAPGTQR